MEWVRGQVKGDNDGMGRWMDQACDEWLVGGIGAAAYAESQPPSWPDLPAWANADLCQQLNQHRSRLNHNGYPYPEETSSHQSPLKDAVEAMLVLLDYHVGSI